MALAGIEMVESIRDIVLIVFLSLGLLVLVAGSFVGLRLYGRFNRVVSRAESLVERVDSVISSVGSTASTVRGAASTIRDGARTGSATDLIKSLFFKRKKDDADIPTDN